MKRYLFLFLILAIISLKANADSTLHVLCYHDIVENINGESYPDDRTVRQLVSDFGWLKESGYTVISAQDLLDAHAGKKVLPEKSAMLTFDDGYRSFYTHVFPLLKAFNYPATLGVVGSWLETADSGMVFYGGKQVPRSHFVSLKQLKEMHDSGLVEIASHSYDLHHGVLGNPQGNEMPAATTRSYDRINNEYEDDVTYEARISNDLKRNSKFIELAVGQRPRVMVWPYGRYNGLAQEIAKIAGMEINLSLSDESNSLDAKSLTLSRDYMVSKPYLSNVASDFQEPKPRVIRVMHVDLDYIYSADPTEQEKNLSLLLERIKEAGVNTVFLQAFADDDASGVAKSLYFPNSELPMKADLFGRVSWQISTRTGARVFAWLPLTAFIPQDDRYKGLNFVQSYNGISGVGYQRLSSFSFESRKYIQKIYEDLGKYTYFSGLIIHDDATLSDFEDSGPDAMQYYSSHLGLPKDVGSIRSDPQLMHRWTKFKTEHLSLFARELREATQNYRKPIDLARNYYAEPILNPVAEEWFSQSLEDGLKHFDWVAVMAMPYMEKAKNPKKWLELLVQKVQSIPGADKKVIFELQAKDWNKGTYISNHEMNSWMKMLRVKGALNFGYYPDDPFSNHPDIQVIKKELSRKDYVE